MEDGNSSKNFPERRRTGGLTRLPPHTWRGWGRDCGTMMGSVSIHDKRKFPWGFNQASSLLGSEVLLYQIIVVFVF